MRTLAATTLVLLALAAVARADVIYDTLWITDQQTYDWGFGNAHGGQGASGDLTDARLADDFVVDAGEYPLGLALTSVTLDSLAVLGVPPREGFMVRVYADEAGSPADQPTLEVAVPVTDATVTNFDDTIFDTIGMRFELDLSFNTIELSPGTYWLNIQPVDTTPQGDWWWQPWDNGEVIGADAHYRDDHFVRDWVPTESHGQGPGTIAMRIEGNAIPAPATLLPGLILLSAAGCGRGRGALCLGFGVLCRRRHGE